MTSVPYLHRALSGQFLYAVLVASVLMTTAKAEEVPSDILKMPQCNLSKTNFNCKLLLDRSNPIAPPTVQMYSDQFLVVIVKRPLPYERYFLDYSSSAATLTPDVTSNIAAGLITPLGHLVLGVVRNNSLALDTLEKRATYKDQTPCSAAKKLAASLPDNLAGAVTSFQDCLGELGGDAIKIYSKMEPLVSPDSLTFMGDPQRAQSQFESLRSQIVMDVAGFTDKETPVSGAITVLSSSEKYKKPPSAPSYAAALTQLGNIQKLMDGIATDLLAYGGRLKDLATFQNGSVDCAQYVEDGAAGQCIAIRSRKDNGAIYHNMVSRTVTYTLDTLNLVANSQEASVDPSKKKSLGSIAINFADKPEKLNAFRWEASAGVFFSTLPVQSFSVAPVYTNLVITDNYIQQTTTRPTVVPFAAANYRLTDDLPGFKWKSNLYWTIAAGVNLNTVTADFATGLSFSWRALMVSALCHFGHETRLTGGFTPGEHLGATFTGTLPTENRWTESFALGVSVRVPSLTGR